MDALNRLKAEVFAKQKTLAKIYKEFGEQSLFDYAQGWKVSLVSKNTRAFFDSAGSLLQKVYPESVVNEALIQTGQMPLVSTIDHHGILNHPFFVNSNLIFGQRRGLKYLLCLSTAGVSLNNSSWPGCLLLSRPDGQTERLSFFPDRLKTRAVLTANNFSKEDSARVENQIKTLDFLPFDGRQRLLGLIQEIFHSPELFNFKNFAAQASYVSGALWEKIFPDAPKLLYLPLESLISDIIVKEIAANKDHLLYKLFFTAPGWDSIEKYFSGTLGAFGGGHKGSFLFWGIDGKGRRIRLARQKDKLYHGDFAVSSSAESIVGGLQTGKLYPTSLICFLVLLYYGVTCLGGFNQVNWLTDIKEKFADLLAGIGEKDLAAWILSVPTENFAEGSLAFGISPQGQIYKPTGLDLFLRNDPGIYEKYRQLASKITLGESIDAALPEIYKIITPAPDRIGSLADLTESTAINESGLADKVREIFLP
jgi:hypothetical protein